MSHSHSSRSGLPSPDPAAAASPPTELKRSLPLTKAHHVREAAAAMFNDSYKKWKKPLNAHQVRALTGLLALAMKCIETLDVEARIHALEDAHRRNSENAKRAAAGQPPLPAGRTTSPTMVWDAADESVAVEGQDAISDATGDSGH